MRSKEPNREIDKGMAKRPAKQSTAGKRVQPAHQPHTAEIIQRARLTPGHLTPRDMLQLQNTVGNRALGTLLGEGAQQRPDVQAKTRENGLPAGLKAGVESLSGMSLDDVKVHYNSSEPSRLEALAYTRGTEIHVAPGQEEHLAHEAWHVVQQKQGRVRPTTRFAGTAVNDNHALESEADSMAERVVRAVGSRDTAQAAATFRHESSGASTVVQSRTDMKLRKTRKGNINKLLRTLRAAVDADGNRLATLAETNAHDSALHAGQHHGLRGLRLNTLIGDLEGKVDEYTNQNLTDSDALGEEVKAGRGNGQAATQLKRRRLD